MISRSNDISNSCTASNLSVLAGLATQKDAARNADRMAAMFAAAGDQAGADEKAREAIEIRAMLRDAIGQPEIRAELEARKAAREAYEKKQRRIQKASAKRLRSLQLESRFAIPSPAIGGGGTSEANSKRPCPVCHSTKGCRVFLIFNHDPDPTNPLPTDSLRYEGDWGAWCVNQTTKKAGFAKGRSLRSKRKTKIRYRLFVPGHCLRWKKRDRRRCEYGCTINQESLVDRSGRFAQTACRSLKCECCGPKKRELYARNLASKLAGHKGELFVTEVDRSVWASRARTLCNHGASYERLALSEYSFVVISTAAIKGSKPIGLNDAVKLTIGAIRTLAPGKRVISTSRDWALPVRKKRDREWKSHGILRDREKISSICSFFEVPLPDGPQFQSVHGRAGHNIQSELRFKFPVTMRKDQIKLFYDSLQAGYVVEDAEFADLLEITAGMEFTIKRNDCSGSNRLDEAGSDKGPPDGLELF
jgi:hypothetical protein